MLHRLAERLSPNGLLVRGGFHPRAGDDAPLLDDGTRPATLLLIGNAGPAMWHAFRTQPDRSGRHPLDDWLHGRIRSVAADVGAGVRFPNDGPPFVPIQDWAARAEPVHRSPIGLMIHPEYGLWHVYRAVLL
ncbi:MAG: ferredoxin, partial [Rhodospirillaceae bacterium]